MWKYRLNTLIINHLVIKFKLYGFVAVEFRNVPLFFNVTRYTLILFWLGTHASKYQFKQFLDEFQIYLTVEWSLQCLTKTDSVNTTCNHNKLKEFNCFYIHARNNLTPSLTTMLIGYKHISFLCLSTWCHGKSEIWTYFTLIYSYHVFKICRFYRIFISNYFSEVK